MNAGKGVVIPINVAPAAGCSTAASCSSAASCGAAQSAGADGDAMARLQGEGWVLRTTIGEPRLSEVAENYRAMGHEVHVEYFDHAAAGAAPGEGGVACTTCFDAADMEDARQRWGSIYVRRGRPGMRRDDELY